VGSRFATEKAPAGATEKSRPHPLSPLRGLIRFTIKPTADAVGCFLPPLRGWAAGVRDFYRGRLFVVWRFLSLIFCPFGIFIL
jgi:hypothetical protein